MAERKPSKAEAPDATPLSRFDMKRKLGEGGMGVVYEAYDRELRMNVALKTFHHFGPAQLFRLKQEFRALAELSHRNLVTLYELLLVDDACYISMELIEDAQSFLEHVRPLGSAAAKALRAREAGGQDSPTVTAEGSTLGTGVLPSPAEHTQSTAGVASVDDSASMSSALTGHYHLAPSRTQLTHGSRSRSDAQFRRLQSATVGLSPRLQRLLAATLDLDKLRPALAQLCQGVHGLHRMGKIHRDLKPRNVLVATDRRVVICDFGLVTEIQDDEDDKSERPVEGTLAYMSPEQAANRRLTFASDWFAVGVMLYEALTARRPFPYKSLAELRHAHANDALVPPHELAADVPEDLDELCCQLLSFDPADRPSGAEILARLGKSETTRARTRPPARSDRPLVGRTSQMAELAEAYDATRKGKTVVQFVHGAPGIGKSALAKRFLANLPSEVAEDLVLLSARCYASESVPYNAIDGLVDALSVHLKTVPAHTLERLLPDGVAELARLFPVLQRIQAIAELAATKPRPINGHEQRRHAFSALTEILRRLAADHSLLLFIDNFQHCDQDSARLLVHVLDSHPNIPVLLLVCEKHHERGSSWFVRQLGRRQQQGTWSSNAVVREMTLTPLSVPQGRALATLLLDAHATPEAVERTVTESGGNPLYLEELTAAWLQRSEKSAALPPEEREADLKEYAERLKIENVLLEPTHSLSLDARSLVRVAAVAGRPVAQGIMYQAADLGKRGRQAATDLRTARLIRIAGLRESDRIEIAHDGLRSAVLSTLHESAIEELHRRLANAMVQVQSQDFESLSEHWLGAHEPERARIAAITAAERAAHSLAFDRAARLYRAALGLRAGLSPQEERELRARLAETLASSGRTLEAATTFLAVARGGSAAEAIEYRHRASELYFQSGCVDEGITVLYEALEYYGMHLPRKGLRARASLSVLRTRLKLRGFRFQARDESEVADVEHKRADLCTSALLTLATVNGALGAQLHARNLLRSLEVGEPKRLARAIALEPVYTATCGHQAADAEAHAAQTASELAADVGDPATAAFVGGATALWHYHRTRFEDAKRAAEEVIELQENAAETASFENNTVRLVELWSLYYLGQVEHFLERVRNLVQDAETRGDTYMLANLYAGVPSASWLLADDVQGASWSSAEAYKAWPTRADRHIQGYWEAFAVAQRHLYVGEKGTAWEALASGWAAIEHGAFMRAPFVHAEAWHVRGRCAIDKAAAGTREQVAMLREARRAVSKLERSKSPIAQPWSKMLKAGLHFIEGHRRVATELLEEAQSAFEALGLVLYAAACRWRRGELMRGTAGIQLTREAETELRERRVGNPHAFVGCLAPGFPGAGHLS